MVYHVDALKLIMYISLLPLIRNPDRVDNARFVKKSERQSIISYLTPWASK